MKISLLSVLLVFGIISCKKETEDNSQKKNSVDQIAVSSDKTAEYLPQSVNDSLAIEIKDYVNTKVLNAEDQKIIDDKQREFQMYQVDLNNDGYKEIFVYLKSNYFCGSGGCTVLLLSDKLEPITKFTVTRPPFFIEPTFSNGWKILTLKSENEWKSLVYDNGKYPGNPSLLDKASYDAPSGHAEVVFEEKDNLKIYKF